MRRWAALRGWRRAVTSTQVVGSMPSSRKRPHDTGIAKIDFRAPAVVQQIRRRRALRSRTVTRMLGWRSLRSRSSGCPTITVVVVSSQTVHADSLVGQRLGDDGRRTRNAQQRSALGAVDVGSLTTRGFAALPAIKRADAKFKTGCNVSPTRTYSAPDSRDMTIAASPTAVFGRRNARTAHTAMTMAARTQPAMNAKRLCPHRIVQHADVSAQQRVLHPAHKKSDTR